MAFAHSEPLIMNFADEVTRLKQRLTAAETARDAWGAWGASGRTEQYLQAYCDVEALERQLDERLRLGPDAPA